MVCRQIDRARLVPQCAGDADESRLQERQGGAVTNFPNRLPPLQSDLARDVLKDPYIFDFLGLTESAQERDIENALTRHITRFLLELGAGFAFVARQYRLKVAGDEFFIDLLFYHLKLRCYVVVERRFFSWLRPPLFSLACAICITAAWRGRELVSPVHAALSGCSFR